METATLQLPKDLIEAAIKQNVTAALVAALGDKSRILTEAVSQVLTMKVDSEGKPGRGYGHDVEFIQWAVRDTMQAAIRQTLNEEIAKYKDTIRDHIAAQLSRKNSPLLKQLADSMAGAMVNAASDKWRLSVSFDER